MSKPVSLYFTRSDKRTFSLDGTLFGVTEITGLDAPTVEIFKQANAVGSGDIITGKRVASREIQCSATLKRPSLNESVRAVVTTFFNPAYTFNVLITYGNAQKMIKDAELKGFKAPTGNVYQPLELTLTLLCPDGYLLSVDDFAKDLASISGRFGWPFISVANVGFLFGKFNFAQTVELVNDGDAETRFTARMFFDGAVTDPVIYNGSSYIKLIGSFAANDEAVIDIARRRVTLNGANAITLVDRGSNFDGMTLAVGESTIRYDASVNSNLMHVTLVFHKRYLGVG